MRFCVDTRRVLKCLVCLMLVGGLVTQICLLAEISGKTKEISRVNAETERLSAQKDNLEVQLASFRSTERIRREALELGMQLPQEDQLRVISIPQEYQEASTHTAEIAGVK